MTRWRHHLARVMGRLRRGSRRVARMARSRWRGSLMLRVVTTTVVLGMLVLLVVGELLLQAISNNLVESARVQDQNDAIQQIQITNAALHDRNIDNVADLRVWTTQRLQDMRGPATAPLRAVALRRALDAPSGTISDVSFGLSQQLPRDLRVEVVKNPDRVVTQQLTLPLSDGNGRSVTQPVIVVGKLIDLGKLSSDDSRKGTGAYELYLAYPLDREAQILADVQRTLLAGGVALISLIGLVTWVVTRQVVAPVRQAVRAAEELASGQLDKRIMVHGEDDLARLGRAFNEMAASLERQIEQLRELSRVQRRFVSDVSHELRTPLTTVRMAGEVIYEARGDFEPALARTAELLQAQLDRFEALLSDLLEVSRFDAGAAVLENEQVDLRNVVERVTESLRPLAERRGSALVVNKPELPVSCEADPRRIERILRNLVDNAIEHGEGRPVEITVAMDAAAVAVGVRDHGVGLNATEVRRVFDRFWRADPARARHTGGTGLGLAISLEDAHLHGGWLQVWGETGQGAHFRLTLPRVSGELLTGSPIALNPPPPLPGRGTQTAEVGR